jgi:hypothetical protein
MYVSLELSFYSEGHNVAQLHSRCTSTTFRYLLHEFVLLSVLALASLIVSRVGLISIMITHYLLPRALLRVTTCGEGWPGHNNT